MFGHRKHLPKTLANDRLIVLSRQGAIKGTNGAIKGTNGTCQFCLGRACN